jgi:NADH dehydrogenase
MTQSNQRSAQHRVTIIGGGFGGLYTAKALRDAPVEITLLDKRNFHLFQPLLYQVATGGLSPGDIASPLRSVLKNAKNTRVMKAEVIDIDPQRKEVVLRDGRQQYDTLVVAAGAGYHYFGNDQWAENAPSLKTVEDAIEIRRRILLAFEAAEREPDPELRQAWLTFVIVGGGPTGVELAGALGELANSTLPGEFHNIDPSQARIIVVETMDSILTSYPSDLAAQAGRSLQELGVEVLTNCSLVQIEEEYAILRDTQTAQETELPARTVLWAAGIKASPLGQIIAERTGADVDRIGRVVVQPDLSLLNHEDIFVIGDLAHFPGPDGEPLPGVAQVAMQQGEYVARRIGDQMESRNSDPFYYKDKGSLAVIGRNAAVADLGYARFSGFFAWLIWIFIHIRFLIEFDNKLLVLTQWAWNYFTRGRGARLITGRDPFPLVRPADADEIGRLFREPTPIDQGWATSSKG